MIIKSIIKRSLTLLAGLSLLGFGGCRTSDDPESAAVDDNGKMVLRINVAFDSDEGITRAGGPDRYEVPTDDDFEKISTLRVIIFRHIREVNGKMSGVVEANRMVMTNDQGHPVRDNLEFEVYANEKKRIYLIANEGSLTPPDGYTSTGAFLSSFDGIEDINNLEPEMIELNDWTVSVASTTGIITGYENGLFSSSPSSRLPLTEFFDLYLDRNTSNPEGKSYVTMFMTRAAAKATFYLDPDAIPTQYKGISIESISLSGVGSEEYVFPHDAKYSPEPKDDLIKIYDTDPSASMMGIKTYISDFTTPASSKNLTFLMDDLNIEIAQANAGQALSKPMYFPESILKNDNYEVGVTLSSGVSLTAKLTGPSTNILNIIGKGDAIARNTHLVIYLGFNGPELTAQATVLPYTGVLLNPEFGVIVEPTGVMIDMVDADEDGFIKISKGNTYWLAANITPEDATEKTLTWESSNPEIATVNEKGMVTAVSEGDATITVHTSNYDKDHPDDHLIASCKIRVTKEVVPTQIIFDSPTATLLEGENLSLNPVVLNAEAANKALTWNSSNTNVATVDADGKITAVNAGETTITATSVANQNVTAICKITVIKKMPVTGVSLPATATISVSVRADDGRVRNSSNILALIPTITPSDATITRQEWWSGNEEIAVVDNGSVTALSNGTVDIYVKINNSDNLTAKCSITVTGFPTAAVTLVKTEAIISVGSILALTNAVNRTWKWDSDNPKVATVENGCVTGVSPGTANISVTTTNNSTSTCTIKVIDLTLDKINETIQIGKTLKLEATVKAPADVHETINWSSSNTDVATVSADGVVTALRLGNATIMATTTNNASASCEITVVKNEEG